MKNAMRFLGVGSSCDLGALYLRLLAEGHEVRVYVGEPLCRGTLNGLITHVSDWRDELEWIRQAGDQGIILFENVSEKRGRLQDDLRRAGYNVIGGSEYGDRLENERGFAQDVLQSIGLKTCPVSAFTDREEAACFVRANPKRYVVKFDHDGENFVGRLADGRDVVAFLTTAPRTGAESFILMDFVEGVEMGVGAYFDGENFLKPACLDWEHKRFFPKDLGELTGEMGTIVTYDFSQKFFDLTLGRMSALLRKGGYCGYININTIVNRNGIWPLEFTCRFGYPGFAILDPLQMTSWSDLFRGMATRSLAKFKTRSGFAAGIVLTTPPFPYSRMKVNTAIGLPVMLDALEPADLAHIHYGEVGLYAGQLVTTGAYGWTLVVTAVADTIQEAQQTANERADRIVIPNVRYRRDIGSRLIEGELRQVEALGLFSSDVGDRANRRVENRASTDSLSENFLARD